MQTQFRPVRCRDGSRFDKRVCKRLKKLTFCIRKQDSKAIAAASGQVRSRQIADVSQFRNGIIDRADSLFPHPGSRIQNPVDRGKADTRFACYVVDCWSQVTLPLNQYLWRDEVRQSSGIKNVCNVSTSFWANWSGLRFLSKFIDRSGSTILLPGASQIFPLFQVGEDR